MILKIRLAVPTHFLHVCVCGSHIKSKNLYSCLTGVEKDMVLPVINMIGDRGSVKSCVLGALWGGPAKRIR